MGRRTLGFALCGGLRWASGAVAPSGGEGLTLDFNDNGEAAAGSSATGEAFNSNDLGQLVHGVVQNYVAGAFPSASQGDDVEGSFVGWSSPKAKRDAVASTTRSSHAPALVRRQPSSADVPASAVELGDSIGKCTSGPEDYRGHYCNYTAEHIVCARIGPTESLHGNENFWTATDQTWRVPRDAGGWECIKKTDYDSYVTLNGCALEIQCDAIQRAGLCENVRENDTYYLNHAQECIVQMCGGICGHRISGFDDH